MNPAAAIRPGIASRYENLLGSKLISSDALSLHRYAIDGILPTVVVHPESAEQIAAVLKIANEENWTVAPLGGGTRRDIGRAPEKIDAVLSTGRLNQIEAYDPGDLTISVQAGANVRRVVEACAQHRQLLPIEAAPDATIGGALATGAGGPLRAGYGGLRDFCIGIGFITGDGASGRGGGRVVKNVAGYDLMKLMIGSYGSLGVIVSANFRLFPLPRKTVTCVCEFASAKETLNFRDWLLKSPLSPIAVEIVSPEAGEYLRDVEPRDPDFWAPVPRQGDSKLHWKLAVRFAGSDLVLERCRREVSCSLSQELQGSDETEFWDGLGNFERQVVKRHRNAIVFHLDVPIAETQTALEAAQIAATDYNFIAAVIGRATIGSFVVAFLTLAIDPPAVTQYAGAASHFRSRLSKSSSAIVVRCPVEAKHHFDVWGSTPTDIELMQRIKRALDPGGILNRGRFLTE